MSHLRLALLYLGPQAQTMVRRNTTVLASILR